MGFPTLNNTTSPKNYTLWDHKELSSKTVSNFSHRRLEKIDLSYNKIEDLIGLRDIRPGSHALKHLDLNGNNVTSLNHAIQCLANCTKLEVLIFKDENDGNPICEIPAYRPNMFAQLPLLRILDGKDQHGNPVMIENSINQLNTGETL